MQNINLFRAEFSQKLSFPDFRQATVMLGGAFALMLLLVLYQWFSSASLSSDIEEASAELQKTTAHFDQLQAELPHLSAQSITEQITQLKTKLSDLRNLRAMLAGNQDLQEGQGQALFSSQFEALGREHIPGISLSQIKLSKAGEQVELSGSVSSPEIAPRYLAALYQQDAFIQAKFGQLNLKRDAAGGPVRFSLQHEPDEDSQ